MRLRVFCWVFVALLLATHPATSRGEPGLMAGVPWYPKRPLVLRIEFDTREELQALAAQLDVWEVHPEEGYLVALVGPEEYVLVRSGGYRVQVDAKLSAHPETIPPGYPCYRTIEELYDDLEEVVADHAGIAQLATIGLSYEARPLRVIRLTNRAVQGEKPILFLIANIHGREIITNEAAMVLVDYLTDHYGVDADATWLLDHHEVHVMVSANPDGHVKNELGEKWSWWRKNTHPYGSCSEFNYGVDLNRNHDFKWGCCGGSSGNPCTWNYRGPSAASEPETQALQEYVLALFPDRRGPDDSDPAPQDTSGVLISLHSYGDLVLWPWGSTEDPPPNSAGIEALGHKLASYTGYQAYQSYGLYATDGTTDDWSYGELGIASYTFEIGSREDGGFYPLCDRYDALIQPNLQAFLYAARVARAPYMLAHGPDALSVVATPGEALVGSVITLTAQIAHDQNGGDEIAWAEYYLGDPPWAGGVATPMEPEDGAFDSSSEGAVARLPTGGWSPGQRIVFVRGRDAEGNWGPPSAVFVGVRWRTVYVPFLDYRMPQPTIEP